LRCLWVQSTIKVGGAEKRMRCSRLRL
jgi:hypothetical protein